MRKELMTLVLVALMGTACATNGPTVGAGPDPSGQWFEVQVENNTPSPLRVFLLDRGGETLLGRVDPVSERTLRIAALASPTVQFVARPSVDLFPDRAHRSEFVSLMPGQRITWQLRASPGASDLPRFSTIRVLPCDANRGC